MASTYSLDLRRRVVLSYERGEGNQKEVAEQFGIGYRTLKGWLALKRITGDVKPKEQIQRGPLPVIDDKGLIFIQQLVEKKPDILISEIQELYGRKFKVSVLQSMVSRAFKKLNLRRKKKSEYAMEQEREDIKKNEKDGKKR